MASRVRDRLVSGMNAYVSHSQRSQAKPTLASRPPNSAQEKNSLLRGRLRPILLPHQNSTQSTSRTGARGNLPENNSEVKHYVPRTTFCTNNVERDPEELSSCPHFFFHPPQKANGHAANGSTAFHQVGVVEETGNLTYPGMYVTTRKTVCVILYSTLLYEPEPRETG